jgi:hypothetical protein
MNKNKCIIICNGPSIINIKKYNFDFNDYHIIGVNRWINIFKSLNLPLPNTVIIGQNSFEYNKNIINNNNNIKFIGLNKSYKNQNYSLLKFGNMIKYNKNINFYDSLWWTGIYAIQYALQQEYDEIHIFGFSCNNLNDFNDTLIRANIPSNKIHQILLFFNQLKENNILKYIKIYENNNNHLLKNFF